MYCIAGAKARLIISKALWKRIEMFFHNVLCATQELNYYYYYYYYYCESADTVLVTKSESLGLFSPINQVENINELMKLSSFFPPSRTVEGHVSPVLHSSKNHYPVGQSPTPSGSSSSSLVPPSTS